MKAILKTQLLLLVLFSALPFVKAQHLDQPSISYLKKNSHTIKVNHLYQDGNWKPIKRHLKNKQIVLLGEFNHGSKQIFDTRNDLIKYLHENLGFNTILLESGIGELIEINYNKENISPTQMTTGLFGPWRTKEFVDLMEYVQQHNLSISGFDVQRSGRSFDHLLEKTASQLGIDHNLYQDIEKHFGEQKNSLNNRKAVYDEVKPATIKLIDDYQSLLEQIELKSDQDQTIALVKRTLHNRIEYLKYFLAFAKNKDWNQRWKARDSIMASNVEWLMEHLYKDEKVIIIAHNFHIAKYNEKEEVMGEFLKPKYGSAMYILGIFAGKGSYSGNSGKEKQLSPIDSEALDIKEVISSLDGKVNFFPIPSKSNKRNFWAFEKIIVNDTFIDLSRSNEMDLSKHFDGLLFIDKISPPEK